MDDREQAQVAAIDSMIDCAAAWNSADADRSDTMPAEWQDVAPLLRGAPEMLTLLQDCLGAMSVLRQQVDQMSGLFPDDDDAITVACEAHDETAKAVRTLLQRIRSARTQTALPVLPAPVGP